MDRLQQMTSVDGPCFLVPKFCVDLQWQEADWPKITDLLKQSAGGDEDSAEKTI